MSNKFQKMVVRLPDEVLEEIRGGIVEFGKVKVTGLGIFETRKIAGHPGRHPVSGKIIKFPAHVRVKFRPTASLYSSVQS